jgi:hypothetical protein
MNTEGHFSALWKEIKMSIPLGRHIAYMKYVLRHKYFVFMACWKLSVPIWIAIFHDWDKFLPSEWIPYASTFYDKSGNKQYKMYPAFSIAWNAHQKWNKHHWQYWMLTWDRGETECLPMPEVYCREMVADWIGAGRALGKPDTAGWYSENRVKIKLHEDSRETVERLLAVFCNYDIRRDHGKEEAR